MQITVTQHDFTEAMRKLRPDNFSYEGQIALFDYLEQYEEDTGEQIELDVIALCCEYSEVALEDLPNVYLHLVNYEADADAEAITIEEWIDLLQAHTQVIQVSDDTLIIAEF